jgi:hypothetical protein
VYKKKDCFGKEVLRFNATFLSGQCAVVGGIFAIAPSSLFYERKLASPRKKAETYTDSYK